MIYDKLHQNLNEELQIPHAAQQKVNYCIIMPKL